MDGAILSSPPQQKRRGGKKKFVSKSMDSISQGINSIALLMSLIKRKPVFGFGDQVQLKLACSASYRLEIWDIETRGIILSKQ